MTTSKDKTECVKVKCKKGLKLSKDGQCRDEKDIVIEEPKVGGCNGGSVRINGISE